MITFCDTDNNAYAVQLSNQSIVQQLTSEGNLRHLIRKASPAGLIHKIICKLALIFDIKYDHNDYGLSTFFFFNALGRTLLII